MTSWCEVLTMDFYKVAFLLGAFICTGLRADQPHNATGPQCEMFKADIVILLDASENIDSEDFNRMKSFISDLVQNLPIGPNEVQIGLTQFSFFGNTEWHLNYHNNTQSLLKAIDRIKPWKHIPRMGRGLDYVLKNNFQPSAGMRPDAKKKVVMITEGKSTDNVFIPAQNLKHSGIEIYVIGVGQELASHMPHAIDQLRTVASEHFQSHFYFFSSFQSLHNAANNISSILCHGPTNQEQQGSQCKMSKADIVILLAGSRHIDHEDFPIRKSFIFQIVKDLPIGPNEVQIGLTQYSHYTETEWDLNSHNNKQSLLHAINAIQQTEQTFNMGAALDHVLKHDFQLSAGMRPDSKKKLILIAYERSTDTTEIPAKNLKDSGVEIYAIGVGRRYDNLDALFQMASIASNRYGNRLFTSEPLHNTVIKITNSLCATNMEKLGSQCKMSKTDIVILVDGSSNIDAVKSFISHLVQNLPIGPNEVQIGLTHYRRKAETVWDLNSHNNTQSLLQAINATQLRSGNGYYGKALDHVLNHSFQSSAGMRPDSKKKLILITDGYLDSLGISAQNLKDRGIEIYLIVQGTYVYTMYNTYQLMTFASEDVKRHYYLFPTYQSLHNAAINISSSLCHDAHNREQQGSQCETSKADIVMLVNGRSGDFNAVKSFMSQVVQNLPIGPNNVQIGLTQYGRSPENTWHLNRYKTKRYLLEAIDRTQELHERVPFIGRGLDHVRNHSFTPSAGMRPDSKKKVVLITDGFSADEVGIPAQNLKDSGIELYVIVLFDGASRVRSMCQLRTMASEDIKRHLYLFPPEQSFHNIVANFSSSLCHGDTNLEQLELQTDQTNSTDLCWSVGGLGQREPWPTDEP